MEIQRIAFCIRLAIADSKRKTGVTICEWMKRLICYYYTVNQKEGYCNAKSNNCHERLTATLRFLATGRSYEDLKYSTIISPQAMCYMIPETCKAIYNILKNEHL
ncbi:hypothetical protein NQ317_018508 [Molorchus minor]|uniref:Uncharacterized protein n=1 Tax=Molorchus minor TaxID=1323400 RepID=A0ABQ9JB88_9CUCU|nr:hypothetical protein NQ317_018508 [Molorchus minor]